LTATAGDMQRRQNSLKGKGKSMSIGAEALLYHYNK
jgi:hypothetical protein